MTTPAGIETWHTRYPTKVLPQIRNYGRYTNPNYGRHTLEIDFGPLVLFYSYDTIVAFWERGRGLHVSQNLWGPTTGKHLRWIETKYKLGAYDVSPVPLDMADPKHPDRWMREDFVRELEAALDRHIKE